MLEIVTIFPDGKRTILANDKELEPYKNDMNLDLVKAKLAIALSKCNNIHSKTIKTLIVIVTKTNSVYWSDSASLAFDSLKDKLPV